MATTRAKFKCISITNSCFTEGIEYKFTAVQSNDIPEDQSFSRYTPVGNLSMTVNNPNIKFELGGYYYLDFIPAEVTEIINA